jgi:hypothetical protein
MMQLDQDKELLDVFHLMDKDEKEFFLESAKIHTKGRTLRRPTLRLLSGGLPTKQAGTLGRSFA